TGDLSINDWVHSGGQESITVADELSVGDGDGERVAQVCDPGWKNPEDNSAYVSVFIALASEGTDVRALFELTLVDQSGKEKHKVHSHFDRSLESGPYTLKYRGSMCYLLGNLTQRCDMVEIVGEIDRILRPADIYWFRHNRHDQKLKPILESLNWSLTVHQNQFLVCFMGPVQVGYKRFFRRALLETSDFLKDDCLKINCTVGVVVSAVDCPRLHSIRVPESDIGTHFGMLLEKKEGSDISFVVAGEKFRGHKLVLAARSPIFRSKFFEGLEEDNTEVEITDLEPKVFKAMLHFIYRDSLTEDVQLETPSTSPTSLVSDSLTGKLLAAADKYGLDRLRLMCESHLCKDISVKSVAEILALADRCNASELKAVCLRFAAENLAAVMRTDGFEHLKEHCPTLQSELLKTIAGCDEECSSGGGKTRSVWAQLSDGGDTNGRRVRQRT
ncbi:hypothetical protein F8388_000710, partial [Cannabis sativa]